MEDEDLEEVDGEEASLVTIGVTLNEGVGLYHVTLEVTLIEKRE